MSRFYLSGFGDEIAPELDTQLDVLETLGVRHIEFRAADGIPVADFSTQRMRLVKKRLDERGFLVSSVGSPIGKLDITQPFEEHLAQFQHVLDLSDVLQTPNIRLFSFFIPEGKDAADYRDEVMLRMEALLLVSQGRGKRLLHENERFIYGDTPQRCLDLMKTFEGELWMNFDPGNFTQCGVEDILGAYALLKPYIRYVHIKDSLSAPPQRVLDMGFQNVSGWLHRPAGQGQSQIPELISTLWKDGYEGFLSLEPHLAGNEDIPGSNARKFSVAMRALQLIIDQVGAAWEGGIQP